MYRISPTFDTPALLSAKLTFLQIGKLPQVMHCVQLADLHEPCPHALHDLATCLESATPVRLPFQQIAWVKSVRPQFKDSTERAGRCGWPERELLHEGCALSSDKRLELFVEIGEFRVVLDGVE